MSAAELHNNGDCGPSCVICAWWDEHPDEHPDDD